MNAKPIEKQLKIFKNRFKDIKLGKDSFIQSNFHGKNLKISNKDFSPLQIFEQILDKIGFNVDIDPNLDLLKNFIESMHFTSTKVYIKNEISKILFPENI